MYIIGQSKKTCREKNYFYLTLSWAEPKHTSDFVSLENTAINNVKKFTLQKSNIVKLKCITYHALYYTGVFNGLYFRSSEKYVNLDAAHERDEDTRSMMV